eukprot:SAG11_NODE_22406_length_406_cov_1.501629_1_plen_38_part_01
MLGVGLIAKSFFDMADSGVRAAIAGGTAIVADDDAGEG